MRKRARRVDLHLSDAEYEHLAELCRTSGLSASSLIRKLLAGEELRPRPPDEYTRLLRELSAIGNNVNQLAFWANARGSATEAELLEAGNLVRRAWRLVKEAF